MTARVSPDGRYLAFMSNRSLTGYDNVDANPAAKGARDEEVYLYDAATKLLLCASCNPNGQPPHGVFDTEKAGEGLGLLVDRRADWAYKPKTAGTHRSLARREHPRLDAAGHLKRRPGAASAALPRPTPAGCSSTAPTRSYLCEGAHTRTEVVNEEADAGRRRERVRV